MTIQMGQGLMKLGAMVRIPVALIRDHQMIELMHDLKVKATGPGQYGFSEKDALIVMYQDEGEYIAVPRQYALEKFSRLIGDVGLEDGTSKGTKVDFRWVGDAEHLRRATEKGKPEWAEKQRRFVEKLYQSLVDSPVHGAIGEAPTSFGKTVCAMKLLSMFGRTALVIVHKAFQLKQWKTAAMEWLQMAEDEIGLVKGPVCEYEGKKIVLAMVETLSQHDYPKEFYEYFGVVMGDEVHRLGAPQWSRAMPRFPAEVRVGISATPRRKDGLERVFKWTIGPVGAREREWFVKAAVFQIAWPVYVEPRRYGIVHPARPGY